MQMQHMLGVFCVQQATTSFTPQHEAKCHCNPNEEEILVALNNRVRLEDKKMFMYGRKSELFGLASSRFLGKFRNYGSEVRGALAARSKIYG